MTLIHGDHPRRFVPDGSDLGDPAVVERLHADLEKRALPSPAALERWLEDWSELDAWLDEEESVRHSAATCHTDDTAMEQRYLDFIEHVSPVIKRWSDRLDRKLLACAHCPALPRDRYGVLLRSVRSRVEIFREANIPLETEDEKLRQDYQKLVGGMSVLHDHRERTMQEMAAYLEQPDRRVRRQAWEEAAGPWREHRERLEEIYDRMVRLRHQMAINAGLPDFRALAFRALERFDYTPADCEAFAAAIETQIVPVAGRLADRRKRDLGLDRLRPWDLAVDPKGRPPLKPFESVDRLIDGCGRIFGKVSADFGEQFERMRREGLLDLASRKAKAPGGYMMVYEGRRLPFIFMNAVGTQDDVQTMLHEGGHAFHAFATREESLIAYRNAPIEFAEVASMGMELLAGRFLEEFYSPADAARARADHFDGVLRFFPYMATIDMLQHWVYTHPGHSREERRAAWRGLVRRYEPWVDHEGFEDMVSYAWHRKGHPFTVPFYYVEYGIAQLGALGIWMNARRSWGEAVGAYRRALALGGSRPLPELFAAAGVRLDFSPAAIGPRIAAAQDALEASS